MDCDKWTERDPCTGQTMEMWRVKTFDPLDPPPDLPKNDPIRESRDKLYADVLRFTEEYWKYERSDTMMTCSVTLCQMMTLVENATTVRIDLNGEEMQLTPHRLAIYAKKRVTKMFVNIQGEIEMELED